MIDFRTIRCYNIQGRIRVKYQYASFLCFLMNEGPNLSTQIAKGRRETFRALREGKLERVILARDADRAFCRTVRVRCLLWGIPCETGGSKDWLGKQCGIDVPCGVVGVYKGKA